MTELLEYMRSDYTSVKIAAANMMSYFFEKLPDMHERVIDAVYDLCEDAEEEVRSLGYKMVCQTAKREHAWTARNADVLVQLLQNGSQYQHP
jgi:Apoptosis inhibitory protein 5 (API5)